MIIASIFSAIPKARRSILPGIAALMLCAAPLSVQAEVTAFKQAIAEGAVRNDALAAYYRASGYEPIWTGQDDIGRARRQALLQAIDAAPVHGLPSARYDGPGLVAMMGAARTPQALGEVEIALSRVFLRLSHDMQTGILTPSRVDANIVRTVPLRSDEDLLNGFRAANPASFFRALPPASGEYARLIGEKMRLESMLAAGGWGPDVPAQSLTPGQSGEAVVALRNRLIRMGFLERTPSASYDVNLQLAVKAFQSAHGLVPDGIAGAATLAEINIPISSRLPAILVAMERERWLNMPRGERHILVNLTDFSAHILDHDQLTFATRAIIGKNQAGQQSPEFSDEMEYLEINPTWNVPRSITVKEYLPQLQRNPGAASHLKLYNARGQEVNRANVDFRAYNARNFPFKLKEPPSTRNALGLVKFMFPNKYNIYLHDTPAKSLFAHNERAFSHGCIRLQDPFEFAYELLAPQQADPKAYFHRILDTRRQTRVVLEQKVPVHIIYRTATVPAKGPVQYRKDIYGRDGRIWSALEKAGVSLPAVQG